MAEKRRRQFSREFKLEAVRLLRERQRDGRSLAEVGRELGVRPDLLRKWKRQAGERAGAAADVFPGNGKLASQDEELRRLKRELEVVKQERDFLKRAAAFFAKESG